jgi:hypothetical protein
MWAALLRRVFALDVFQCPRCGGRRRIVGVHTGGERLRVLLERLGLVIASPSAEPSRSPPRLGALPNNPLVPAFPRQIWTSRRRLPPVFVLALAAPVFFSTRARFLDGSPPF